MSQSELPQRLSQIQTLWTVVGRAHGSESTEVVATAQEQLLARYGKVVHRYLLGALRDAEAADELSQDFALRFVRGDLRGADPTRGRFRDFLKGVLYHLIGDYHRREQRKPLPLPPEHEPAAADEEPHASDEVFLASWRNELLNRAWASLLELEQKTGTPFHSVLRCRAAQPELRSEQMADQLSEQLGKQVNAAWVRQTLHRARDRFAEALLDEVVQTLRDPTIHELEQELIDVGLIEYCRPLLTKMRNNRSLD
jgi:RNA polymerase sigma-70 factor (ECF subfamily)